MFSLKDSLRGEHRGAQRCFGGEPSIDAGRLQPFSSPVRLRGLKGSLSDEEVFFNTEFLGDRQTVSESPTFDFLGDRGMAWTSTAFSEEFLGREPNLEDFLRGN